MSGSSLCRGQVSARSGCWCSPGHCVADSLGHQCYNLIRTSCSGCKTRRQIWANGWLVLLRLVVYYPRTAPNERKGFLTGGWVEQTTNTNVGNFIWLLNRKDIFQDLCVEKTTKRLHRVVWKEVLSKDGQMANGHPLHIPISSSAS